MSRVKVQVVTLPVCTQPSLSVCSLSARALQGLSWAENALWPLVKQLKTEQGFETSLALLVLLGGRAASPLACLGG